MPTTPSRNGPGRLSDAAYVTSVRGGRLPMGEHILQSMDASQHTAPDAVYRSFSSRGSPMRAAEQAHQSLIRRSAPARLLSRVAMALLATLVLLFVWRPTVLHAQTAATPRAAKAQPPARRHAVKATAPKDTSTTTHVVKSGETLWSIAARYYGDGHAWRAIARRNGIPTAGEFSMKSGTKLQVPSRGAVAAVAAAVQALPAPIDTTTPKVATTPAVVAPVVAVAPAPRRGGALTAQTAEKGDAAATAKTAAGKTSVTKKGAVGAGKASTSTLTVAAGTDATPVPDTTTMTTRVMLMPPVKAEHILTRGPAHIGLTDAASRREARSAKDVPTVFMRRVADADEATAAMRAVLQRFQVAPRTGEYVAAPYPVEAARLLNAGRIVRRTGTAAASSHDRVWLQLTDEVEITAPVGVTLAVGDRLLAMTTGTRLAPGVLVGTSTGVLQVTHVDAGRSVRAYVRSQSGAIEQGQALLPLEGAAAPTVRPEPVSGDEVSTTVTWVEPTSLMPSLQTYVLLAGGEAQGIKAGDEFALVRKGASGAEERVGVVRVVRSGVRGSSAVVIRQASADIAIGVAARRIARMP